MVTVKVQGKTFEFSEDEAREVMKQLFGQIERPYIELAFANHDMPVDEATVDYIAENLFEEIAECDEMFWELEEKNIFWLADIFSAKKNG